MKPSATFATKRLCWPVGLITVCCFWLLAAQNAARAQGSVFRLQSAQGQVELQPGGQGPWKPVNRGVQAASPGDHLRTGANGSVFIIRDEGDRIALGPNTEIILRDPQTPRGWRVVVGRMLAFITGRQRLEVRAPGAVCAAEGTVFQLDVAADGTTVLTVKEGQVRFFNDLGSVTVTDSQQSTAKPGEAPTRPIVVDPSSLMAWEANLQTLIIDLEYPQVSTDPGELQRELTRREQALQQQPQDAGAHVALTAVLLDLRRTEEAEAQAQRAVALAPQDAAAAGLLGYALLQTGRPTEADAQFARAAQAEPDNARWQLGLALVALGQRDSRPAVPFLERAAQLAPTEPLPQAYLAAAYLRSGDLAAADKAASEAVRLGPDNYLANTYLAYVRLAQGRGEDALTAAAAAVRTAPDSALAHEVLGTTAFFTGDYPQADEQLRQAIELNPLSASTHLTLAKLLAAEQELEGGVDQAQLAVSLDPESAPARSTLGLLFLLTNDQKRAGREFQKALAVNPSLSEARTGWGTVLAKRGRFREALNEQKAAVSLDTNSAAAETNLGGVYAADGRMKDAIEHLDRAIELQPDWGLPYANLALVYLELNRFREALDAGEKALKLGERSPFVHTVLARIYIRQGRYDRAMAELRQAVVLDETYPLARYELAQLYLRQDRSRDAVREILYSVSTDPSSMLETRRYARTENTLSGGSYDTIHYDARNSGMAQDGTLSYFASGSLDDTDGWRDNGDSAEQFFEVIAGHQSDPKQQLALYSTVYNRTGGLPGPALSPGDPDDRNHFTGADAVLAFRQRLSDDVTATAKYTFRRSLYRFHNPDALCGDDNPFFRLVDADSEHIPELRVDANLNDRTSLRFGYTHEWDQQDRHGIVGLDDSALKSIDFDRVSWEGTPETDTAWLELDHRCSDRFQVIAGGYWGHETASDSILLPKVVAVYHPDADSWLSFIANPIFRSDASELAPVEAWADPRGLNYLNFTEGGAARTYELRYQRLTSESAMLTGALAYQRVRGLLIDVEDPLMSGLPMRALVSTGDRVIADLSYEQWLTDCLTGRAWVRFQDSNGRFPQVGVSGTDWPYTPEWQGGLELDYIDANGWRIGLEPTWVGRRFHDPENTEMVAGYPLVNLSVQWQRNLHQNYFINIYNLMGRDFDTYAGFPQRHFSVYAGLEYRF